MAEEEETLYEYFWDLASLDSYIRQKTAKALITHLDECFRNHGKLVTIPDKLSTNCEDFITASEVIEQYYGPDIAYSLIRLTRGLPSPREGARHGFALALTELLSNLQTITVDLVIIFIDDACPFTSTKEQEDPNNLIGRVLGYMSIIRSGILWRTNATIKDYKTIIDGLVKCSECKSYIKEICYHVMIGSLSQLKKTKYEKDALKYLIEQVLDNAGQGIQNSDTLNLALAIQEQYPDIHKNSDWKDLVIDKAPDSLVRWENPFILHHDNMSKIAECLQARPKQDSSDDQNQESQFHSVWNRILSVYINNKTPSSKQKGAKNKIVPFSTFWKEIVDNGLFATESTHKRRFWGFQFFEKCLLSLSKEHVESLFTSNFMRSLTNHLVDESRYLHEAAARTFEVICQRAKEDNEIVIVLIKELVGKDESRNFDDFTKGNNLKKLTSCLDSQGLITYLNYLKSIVLNQDIPSTASFDKYRRWTIDQMYGLVRNTTSERKEELVKSILGLYIASGFFRVKEIVEDNPKRKRTNTSRKSSKKVKLNTGEGAEADQEKSEEFILEYVSAKPELSQSIRELLRKRLFNVLGELNKIKPSNSENVKNDSTTSNGNAWAYYALKQVLKLENDSRFELLISLDEETQRVKQTAVDCIETIEKQIKKPSKNSTQNVLSQYIAFEWLFSHTALWLFAEPLEAKSILEDLQVCYQKVFKQSKRPRRRKKGDDDMEEDPEPIDVLVDILLGFLGKPSVLLRHLTEQVFEVFCDQMTKTALDLLLSVIETKEGVKGQDELFEEADGMGSDDDDDDGNDDDDDAEEEEDENPEDKGQEKSDETGKQKVVRTTSRTKGQIENVDKDGERDEDDDDSDDDSDDDEPMANQDEEMAEYDAKLAEIFKQKRLEKSKKKDLKYQMIHFKNKVFDLLEIFIRKQPTHPLTLELILPLLATVLQATSSSEQIADRAKNLLDKMCKSKALPSNFSSEYANEILKETHDMAARAPSKEALDTCSKMSIFLVKVIMKQHEEVSANNKDQGSSETGEEDSIKNVGKIYEELLGKYMTNARSRLNLEVFVVFISRFPIIAWELRDALAEFMEPTKVPNSYRQVQAYVLMSKLLKEVANKNPGGSDELIYEFMPKIRDSFVVAIDFLKTDQNTGKRQLKADKLKEILKVITTIIKMTNNVVIRISNSSAGKKVSKKKGAIVEKVQEIWGTDTLVEKLGSIKTLPLYKSSPAINDMINQIVKTVSK